MEFLRKELGNYSYFCYYHNVSIDISIGPSSIVCRAGQTSGNFKLNILLDLLRKYLVLVSITKDISSCSIIACPASRCLRP